MNNETLLTDALIVYKNTKLSLPCGCCKELLMQANLENSNMNIIYSLDPLKKVKLCEDSENWWGNNIID